MSSVYIRLSVYFLFEGNTSGVWKYVFVCGLHVLVTICMFYHEALPSCIWKHFISKTAWYELTSWKRYQRHLIAWRFNTFISTFLARCWVFRSDHLVSWTFQSSIDVVPLAFLLLAPICAFPRRSLPTGPRGIVECRYLHRISWTVTLQASYRCYFSLWFTKESTCKPELDESVPEFRLWYLRMWHGRFSGTCYIEPKTNYFFRNLLHRT